MKRTFASLTPQEGLHVAIFIEERNAEIYRNFAEMFAQFGDPDSFDISLAFREMSSEEHRHSSRLQQRYSERYGNRPCSVTEDDISDLIEVPNLHSTDIFSPRDRDHTLPRDRAFAVALTAEMSALDFYRHLAKTTTDPELRVFYQEFADMESQHVSWLEPRVAGVQQRRAV
jgi:rubrerythrin